MNRYASRCSRRQSVTRLAWRPFAGLTVDPVQFRDRQLQSGWEKEAQRGHPRGMKDLTEFVRIAEGRRALLFVPFFTISIDRHRSIARFRIGLLEDICRFALFRSVHRQRTIGLFVAVFHPPEIADRGLFVVFA